MSSPSTARAALGALLAIGVAPDRGRWRGRGWCSVSVCESRRRVALAGRSDRVADGLFTRGAARGARGQTALCCSVGWNSMAPVALLPCRKSGRDVAAGRVPGDACDSSKPGVSRSRPQTPASGTRWRWCRWGRAEPRFERRQKRRARLSFVAEGAVVALCVGGPLAAAMDVTGRPRARRSGQVSAMA